MTEMTKAPPERLDLELATALFRGFADPSRLAILVALQDGPLSAGQVAERCGLSASGASNHLGCLLECGLVSVRAAGRFNFYAHADPAIARLLEAARSVVVDIGPGVDACINYGPRSRRALRGESPATAATTRQEA